MTTVFFTTHRYTCVNGCVRQKLHRPRSLSEVSQRVSFHISLIVSLSESFCWSVTISVCTCVSLLPCVESRRVVVWAVPRYVAVHRNARCRALVQTNGHSMPWTKLTDNWKLPSANRGVAPGQSSEPSRTETNRGNAMAGLVTRTREAAETECTQGLRWRFVRS